MRRRAEQRINHSGVLAFTLGVLALLVAPGGSGSDIPDAFAQVNAPVYSAVIRNQVLYIGGAFTTVNGSSFIHIAAINQSTGAPISTWAPPMNGGPVRALAGSADGLTLYAGGDFTSVGTTARARLAALSVTSGSLISTWDNAANVDGTVYAMALSSDGRTLYIGGDFTHVGGLPRNHIASVNIASGTVLPWDPNANGVVRALVVAADGNTLFAGGEFSVIGGQPRRGLAQLQVVSGKATTWDAAITGAAVYSLARSGSVLYAGGDYSAIGGQARNGLAALDTALDSNMATAWNPDAGAGAVRALALTGDGLRLYAGGTFTTVNGALARSSVAGFRTDVDGGDVIVWDPGFDSAIIAIESLQISADSAELYVGGDYTRIGATDLTGFAAFAVAAPQTVTSPPAGGHQALTQVTLTCNDRSGAGCAEIYYTTDGSDPQTPVSYTAPVDIAISADTTIKFYSVDADGNREVMNTAIFALDSIAPTTSVSLPAGLYGSADVQPVTLACNDANVALGCTTYYTLDNTTPSTASAVYADPISLTDLFPPAGIPPEEVDPLLHLAGTVTLKFFSVDDAGNAEAVQTMVYAVDLAAPQMAPSHPGGNYPEPVQVALACNDGVGSGCAAMYYTMDNTPPSDGILTDEAGNVIPQTTLYTGPITISSATVLRVLAVDNAGNKASGIAGIYSFTSGTSGQRSSVGGVDLLLLAMLALEVLLRCAVRRQM